MDGNAMFFKEIADRYESELANAIIPFWEQHSIDSLYGGFLTCLERDGQVYDTHKYMWMQWREVYLFALLSNSPFRRERYLRYAIDGFDFLVRYGKKNDGSYYFSLNRAGTPAASTAEGAEIFSESFAVIACAELYRATGEIRYREEACRCWEIYRENVRNAERFAVFPGATPYRVFGHYMIALNVLQILIRALETEDYDRELAFVANQVFAFREPESGLLLERCRMDGSFDLESQDGRLSNPGHALESMWFMLEYIRMSGWTELLDRTLRLTLATLRYGWDSEQGGILYFRDILGKPVGKNECMMKAWWPQNEAAIAAILAYEMSGNEEFLTFFRKIDAFAWTHLRDPEHPEWFAYAAVDGRQVHTFKGSRWKGFFHLPRYLLKCAEICRRLEQAESVHEK